MALSIYEDQINLDKSAKKNFLNAIQPISVSAPAVFAETLCIFSDEIDIMTDEVQNKKILYGFNLQNIKLHRCGTAKNGHHHRELVLLLIDVIHLTDEIGERAFGDLDLVAFLINDLRFGFVGLGLQHAQDVVHLSLRQGRRLASSADETGDTLDFLDHIEQVVVGLHLDEKVAGHQVAQYGVFLAAFDLDDRFQGNNDTLDAIDHSLQLDSPLDGLLDLVLKSRIRVNGIPLALGDH